ncbi:MAG: 2-phospho-L-lactate/phosphoenolpyruvate guanylyltransferase [Thermoleophilaceae bacterium]|jgi:2-phospho-L-lactate guanylyltransferase|nr:2-phospho-L-lactate/phosphoenolpyruvate guanylyltransferase [Thermoleophilaceae bacterium]
MTTIAILPVKSFGAAKQRLASALGAGSRQALAQAMFSDVLASLRRVPGVDSVVVVTADGVAEAAALGERVQVLRDTAQSGQTSAALIGIRHAQAHGFDRVLLVPGDTPLLDPGEVAALLRRGQEEDLAVVVVPDRHGEGTNALLLSPPDAIEPAFGPGSRQRHLDAAEAAGVSAAVEVVPTLALDVDTGADLEVLAATLDGRRGQAPSTRGALRQLDRSRASRTPPVPA